MWGWLQKLFFGGRFGRKHQITKRLTIWDVEETQNVALRIKSGGNNAFIKLDRTELKQLRDAADAILAQNRSL